MSLCNWPHVQIIGQRRIQAGPVRQRSHSEYVYCTCWLEQSIRRLRQILGIGCYPFFNRLTQAWRTVAGSHDDEDIQLSGEFIKGGCPGADLAARICQVTIGEGAHEDAATLLRAQTLD